MAQTDHGAFGPQYVDSRDAQIGPANLHHQPEGKGWRHKCIEALTTMLVRLAPCSLRDYFQEVVLCKICLPRNGLGGQGGVQMAHFSQRVAEVCAQQCTSCLYRVLIVWYLLLPTVLFYVCIFAIQIVFIDSSFNVHLCVCTCRASLTRIILPCPS